MSTLPGNIPDPITSPTFGDSLSAKPLGLPEGSRENQVGKRFWRSDHTRWIHREFLTTDLLCLLISACAVMYAYIAVTHVSGRSLLQSDWVRTHLAILLLMAGTTVLFCQNYGLYRARRTRTFGEEAAAVEKSILLSSLLLGGFLLLAGMEPVSWGLLGTSVLIDSALMLGWRYYEFEKTERHLAAGVGTRNVLIVGAGVLGQQIASCLENNRHLGYVVKGFVDDTPSRGAVQVLGRVDDLSQVARAHFVDEIVIALPWGSRTAARATIEARKQRLNVKLVPNFHSGLGWRAPLEYIGDVPAFTLHREPIPAIALLAKRVLDVAFSACALVTLAPLFGIIAILIKSDSEGPVLYRSTRVGKKGRKFTFYKFRTMVANADTLKEQLRAQNERRGPFFKMANDPRMTRLGKYLRKYSLDELPQFWNVLKGDMSLVGPRPHPLDDFEQYSLDHLRRLDVMPGITGLWQVQARDSSSWEANMELDLEYIENWTPWMDVKIIAKTVPIVLRGLGQ